MMTDDDLLLKDSDVGFWVASGRRLVTAAARKEREKR